MAINRSNLVRKLNALIELDFDAIEAYQAAIQRLRSPTRREGLQRFGEDHVLHTQTLAALVVDLGGRPSKGPNLLRYLTKGKVLIAGAIGGDRAILVSMRINEEVTNRAYQAALAFGELDPASRRLLQNNFADESRHKAWINAQLSGDATVATVPTKTRVAKKPLRSNARRKAPAARKTRRAA